MTEADIFKTSEGKIKKKIAERAVKMIKDGMYINLSIGDPVLIANLIDKSLHVTNRLTRQELVAMLSSRSSKATLTWRGSEQTTQLATTRSDAAL